MGYSANTLSTIAPILLREGLNAFRENAIAARLCGFDVSEETAKRGQTISVEIPTVIPVQEVNVSSANTPTALTPTTVDITLDSWFEAKFAMSDRDIGDVRPGYLPKQALEAIKSLANKVDATILALYKSVYGAYGSPGTTPTSKTDIAMSRWVLNEQLAPMSDRILLLNNDTEASFLSQDAFSNAHQTGDTQALRNANLGRLYGFDIFMDQNMPSHTKGTLASNVTSDLAAKASYAVNATTVVLNSAVGTANVTGTLLAGDIITFAGDTQTYVVTANATAAANEISVVINPGLKIATADGTLVSIKASHGVNLAFNKYAFCFASRPLTAVQGLGSIIESLIDPVSGIALRLEISRGNKQTIWSYDILWGQKCVYPQLAMRLFS